MAYREVKIYDGLFPTHEQIISGDPTAPPTPKEVWLQQVQPGEFAVRYKDFKTGRPRNPQGKPVSSSEICRVFGTLEEARQNSRSIVDEHWTVRCHVYDHSGEEIESVFNITEVNKFAFAMYAAGFLWVALFALGGLAALWAVYRGGLLLFAPKYPVIQLNWFGWCVFAISGFGLGVLGWLASLRYQAGKRVQRVRGAISPEERKRFGELSTLFGTADPAERKRFLELMKEYQQKLKYAMKK